MFCFYIINILLFIYYIVHIFFILIHIMYIYFYLFICSTFCPPVKVLIVIIKSLMS